MQLAAKLSLQLLMLFLRKRHFFFFFFLTSGLNVLSLQRQADFDMVKWKCFASLPACLGHG